MPGLRSHDFDDPRCAECRVRDAVGPCAACEVMICGDCAVLSKDPTGTRCICISCARMIADVRKTPSRRPPPMTRWMAISLAIALLATTVIALLR